MAKKPKKSSKNNKELTYVDSLDFRSMWESFAFDVASNGTLKFPTVWSFICKQTKIDWQRQLLYWMLGPKVEGEAASKYKSFDQFDWATRRDQGHWHSSANIEKLNRAVKSQHDALGRISELGEINIDLIGRLKSIMFQIDREFSAGIMLSSLTAKENAMRASLFMELNQRLLDMLEKAQLMYGRTQGVELEQLNQFLAMFSANMGQAAGMGAALGLFKPQKSNEKDGMKDITGQLIDMVAGKAVAYGLPLPDKDMDTIVVESSKKRGKH